MPSGQETRENGTYLFEAWPLEPVIFDIVPAGETALVVGGVGELDAVGVFGQTPQRVLLVDGVAHVVPVATVEGQAHQDLLRFAGAARVVLERVVGVHFARETFGRAVVERRHGARVRAPLRPIKISTSVRL